MRKRTVLLLVGIVGLVLLAAGSTVGAMDLSHSGFLANSGHGYGMRGGQPVQQGYQRMMNGANQPYHGSMMGGSQQSPVNQGTVAAVSTHLTIEIVTNRPGMQKDWPAFSPSNLVVPANSLVTEASESMQKDMVLPHQ